jgi:hypothetical protein
MAIQPRPPALATIAALGEADCPLAKPAQKASTAAEGPT